MMAMKAQKGILKKKASILIHRKSSKTVPYKISTILQIKNPEASELRLYFHKFFKCTRVL